MAYNGIWQQNQVRGDNGRQGRMFPPPGRRKDWRQWTTGIARQPPVSVGRSESSAPSRQRPKSAPPSSRERGRLNMVLRLALSCWDRALARPYEERIAGAGQQNPIVCEWDKGTVPLSHPPAPFCGPGVAIGDSEESARVPQVPQVALSNTPAACSIPAYAPERARPAQLGSALAFRPCPRS